MEEMIEIKIPEFINILDFSSESLLEYLFTIRYFNLKISY